MPSCGSLWLDPRPTPVDIGKAYQNYYTHGDDEGIAKRTFRILAREHGAARYGFASRFPAATKYLAEALITTYPGLRERLDLMVRYLSASAMGGGRLLDIGCGDGQALQILGDLGWSALGVEIDPSAVQVARSRGLDVRQGTLSRSAFPDGTFDAVTSSHVIEHVHDCRGFLAESYRVLKPGGTLVAVTPNARARSHRVHGEHWLNLDPPRHLALFTADALRALAKSVGLREVRVTTTARDASTTYIASTKIRREGVYQWGCRPEMSMWLRAKLKQYEATIMTKFGGIEGDELVLTATR